MLRLVPPLPAERPEEICREAGCESLATTSSFCRLHYIKNWRLIQYKQAVLRDGSLSRYIHELARKYTGRHLEVIRQDLKDDETFSRVIHELDLHEDDQDASQLDTDVEPLGIPVPDEGAA